MEKKNRKVRNIRDLKHARVGLYARVSTPEQAERDLSIEAQLHEMRRMCQQNNWTIVAEFVEPGKSGTDGNRRQFRGMIDRALSPEKPYDLILVYSPSRFYRNILERNITEFKLNKNGVLLHAVTVPTTGDDKIDFMIKHILAALDQFFSMQLSETVKNAMLENARRGNFNGSTAPLGYVVVEKRRLGDRIEKELAINVDEAELVRRIFKMVVHGENGSGSMGLADIASHLNKSGHTNKSGGHFDLNAISRLLQNEFYIGKGSWNKTSDNGSTQNEDDEVVRYPVPQIVDDELFHSAREVVRARRPKNTPAATTGSTLLLSKLLFCSCGSAMTAGTGYSGNNKYFYYHCSGRQRKGEAKCKGARLRRDLVDSVVMYTITNRLLSEERILALLKEAEDSVELESQQDTDEALELANRVNEAQARLKNLRDALELGIEKLDDDLRERLCRNRDALETAQRAQAAHKAALNGSRTYTKEDILAARKVVADALANGPIKLKQDYLRTVIDRIVVTNEGLKIEGDRNEVLAIASGRPPSPRGRVRNSVPGCSAIFIR